ncbi:hypothetical protein BDF22DRAFT_670608 [Syncephalis plumigaleata]|nr:hypothetical protein BDF22DRAFT_670608 [Syncephalis plumigaleata]
MSTTTIMTLGNSTNTPRTPIKSVVSNQTHSSDKGKAPDSNGVQSSVEDNTEENSDKYSVAGRKYTEAVVPPRWSQEEHEKLVEICNAFILEYRKNGMVFRDDHPPLAMIHKDHWDDIALQLMKSKVSPVRRTGRALYLRWRLLLKSGAITRDITHMPTQGNDELQGSPDESMQSTGNEQSKEIRFAFRNQPVSKQRVNEGDFEENTRMDTSEEDDNEYVPPRQSAQQQQRQHHHRHHHQHSNGRKARNTEVLENSDFEDTNDFKRKRHRHLLPRVSMESTQPSMLPSPVREVEVDSSNEALVQMAHYQREVLAMQERLHQQMVEFQRQQMDMYQRRESRLLARMQAQERAYEEREAQREKRWQEFVMEQHNMYRDLLHNVMATERTQKLYSSKSSHRYP